VVSGRRLLHGAAVPPDGTEPVSVLDAIEANPTRWRGVRDHNVVNDDHLADVASRCGQHPQRAIGRGVRRGGAAGGWMARRTDAT
jgi:hypothetical protein